MTSIFVAKLDFGVTSEDLKKAFQAYGTVLKATVAIDRETGRSRGFGFVEMAEREEAMSAIRGLDGSTMNGRQIAVKEAEQRPDNRPPRDGNRPAQGGTSGRPFQPRSEQNFRPRENDPARPAPNRGGDDDDPTSFKSLPEINPIKPEPRKKVVGKEKKKEFDTDDRNKKTKLSPYKKSGKNNRFFDEDDDDFDPENDSLFNFGDETDDAWDDDSDYSDDEDQDEDED
jgi:RNA recognition motif-containing protein